MSRPKRDRRGFIQVSGPVFETIKVVCKNTGRTMIAFVSGAALAFASADAETQAKWIETAVKMLDDE